MHFKRHIQDILGSPYRHALFYRFPGGLRFALSEGGSPLDEALTALRKATAVCEDVFNGENSILIHLETFVPASRFGLRATLRQLKVAGIAIPQDREIWLEMELPANPDDETISWVSCAFDVPANKLQNLLWCAIATDFGNTLAPNPRCLVYLLHPQKGVLVHPYDDRGMDVVGRETATLAGLYRRHNDLLFAYDMDVMRAIFGQ